MNLADVRAFHERQLEAAKEAASPYFTNLHVGAIKAIDTTRKGHAHIVNMLMCRLQRKQATLDIAHQTLHDQAVDYFNRLDAIEAGHAVTLEELEAEKAITQSLNERLLEVEMREAARRTIAPTAGEQVPEQESAVTAFLSAVRAECDRARGMHPGTEAMCNALTEECGEVAQALVDEPAANVYTECVQVASTAMRVALEGDRAVDFVRARRGLDSLPGSPFDRWDWNEQTLKTPHDLNAVIAHAMLNALTSNNATTSQGETIITLADPAKFALHLAGLVTGALGVHLGIQSRQGELPGL